MLDLDDIQGIILQGYDELESAAFLLGRIKDPAKARDWLELALERITPASAAPKTTAFNLALTYAGFETLGLAQEALEGFSVEFIDGMTEQQRRRALGDHGPSAPETWTWGGPGENDALHLIMLCYAGTDEDLQALIEAVTQESAAGVEIVHRIDTQTLPDHKEHFGFRDGIAQPAIEGYDNGTAGNTIKAGEILLGHENEYGRIPLSPMLADERDDQSLLSVSRFKTAHKDFGLNGSYLVFRQLAQDVKAFWSYLDATARDAQGQADPETRRLYGAKMVGRWPNGAPLIKAPLAPPADDDPLCTDDHFTYHDTDKEGFKCPLGSHIRRSNPRESLEPDPGTEASIQVNKRHRIIRRGRPYGAPLDASMEPDAILKAPDTGEDRGLNFLCFNANLRRQFEFIQQTWINNPKFGGLYNDADPLMGDHDPKDRGETGDFTLPSLPLRTRLTGLPRFTHVVGGAYFFMPGLSALRYLARL